MSKKKDFPEEDFAEFTSEINENLDSLRTSTDQFFKKKLILFCIRWTFTLFLLYIFIDSYSWVKWLMYLAIPLGIINLGLIIVGRKKLNEKLSDTEDKINSL
ncbi:MAG TPA: hypothetical protein ENJ53_07985 [Phaeodactylibacter sp.]|nr:hypothetical protein [Phaeodactylibacter sp.]